MLILGLATGMPKREIINIRDGSLNINILTSLKKVETWVNGFYTQVTVQSSLPVRDSSLEGPSFVGSALVLVIRFSERKLSEATK
jgi:hypothetical protein